MSPRGHRRDPVLDEYVRARLDTLLPGTSDSRVVPGEPPPDPAALPTEDDSPPSGMRGRFTAAAVRAPAFVRAHLVVVLAVVGLGIVVTGYVLTQHRTYSVAVGVSPTVTGSAGASATTPEASVTGSATASGGEAPAQIQIHVLGAVARPGVVRLAAGSRVADAIAAAGGLTSEADAAELNLAAVVSDGSQIVIGTRRTPRGEVKSGSGDGAAASVSGGQSLVDLNTATQAQLEDLPGIGPVTAGRILEWRQSHGRFSRVEELQEITGVGEKTYAQLAPHVRV
ncbi:helix-hairpin-helix domain-containing protein [Propionicicella superfundia]|uniref:helix-hairpin-helix domain-containing protein n=1 Tax=Propionicicella superfundia TaxID=348582 RepID=UPI00040591A3|nr:helix-hairpin-helix domain-containing protein [Propionicicella superfundia]